MAIGAVREPLTSTSPSRSAACAKLVPNCAGPGVSATRSLPVLPLRCHVLFKISRGRSTASYHGPRFGVTNRHPSLTVFDVNSISHVIVTPHATAAFKCRVTSAFALLCSASASALPSSPSQRWKICTLLSYTSLSSRQDPSRFSRRRLAQDPRIHPLPVGGNKGRTGPAPTISVRMCYSFSSSTLTPD